MTHHFHGRSERSSGVVLLLTLVCLVASGQEPTSGIVSGRVFHAETKLPVPFASVMLTGQRSGTSANEEGWFVLKHVVPGSDTLRVSAVGFLVVQLAVEIGPSGRSDLLVPMEEQEVRVDATTVMGTGPVQRPDFPLSYQGLGLKEFQNAPGSFDDISRVLQTLPGVAQTRSDKNDLMVRGGAPSENLFLVDDIEVPNISHFGGYGSTGGSVSYVNLDLVERSTFSTGGFGVKYGDRLSSVVSLHVRPGRADRLGAKFSVAATQYGGHVEGPIGKVGSFLVSLRGSHLQYLFEAYGFPYAPHFWDYLAKADLRLSDADRLELIAVGAIDRVRFDTSTEDKRYEISRTLFSDQDRAGVGLTWRHASGDVVSSVSARLSYLDLDYAQYEPNLARILDVRPIEREASMRWDAVLQLSRTAALSLGIEGRNVGLVADAFANVRVTGFTPSVIFQVDTLLRTQATKGGAYAEISQTFGPLGVAVGGRMEYFDLIDDPIATALRFSTTLALTPVTKLKLSAGMYHQSPSTVWIISNPFNRGLSFTRADQYGAGADHYFRGDLKLSVETYVKDYRDYPLSLQRPYLIMVNTGAGTGGRGEGYASFGLDSLVSTGRGRSHGTELFLEQRPTERPYAFRLGVAYNVTRFRALDGVWRPSDYDQRWIVSLGGDYFWGDEWEVGAIFRYYTGRPYTPFLSATRFQRSSDQYNEARIGENHGLDVRAARRWAFAWGKMSVFIDILNIYNRKPIEVPYFDSRNQRVQNPKTIGIVPSAGISVEF
jgi:hypothetical protein